MITKVDKYLLRQIIENINKLSKGVDPTSDIELNKETIVNQKHVRRLLTEANDYLTYLYHIDYSKIKTAKIIPFFVGKDELSLLSAQGEEITVSKFAHYVNSIVSRPEMKSLRATQITKWLVEEGLLENITDDQKKSHKVATEEGRNIGIRTEERVNSLGETYQINLYSIQAQTYLINHLVAITENMFP